MSIILVDIIICAINETTDQRANGQLATGNWQLAIPNSVTNLHFVKAECNFKSALTDSEASSCKAQFDVGGELNIWSSAEFVSDTGMSGGVVGGPGEITLCFRKSPMQFFRKDFP